MNRLQTELHRLYLARSPAQRDDDAPSPALIDPSNGVRALVMALTQPPSWELLYRVWQGVQLELELPAPGIAVSGTDSLQLWFSLAEPVAVAQAHSFLDCLRLRFLPEIDTKRVRLMPGAEASTVHPEHHARLVPALQEQSGNWSAFVAADLAPVFVDTPWLDIPPNEEGQATLLRGLETMKPAAFAEALKRLAPSATTAANTATPPAPGPTETAAPDQDPRRFLLQVMNDDSVTMALRIEAAKALLQHSAGHRPRQVD